MDLKRSITERFFLRFHMSLILAGTLLAGVYASKGLLAAGIGNPAMRYPLAVAIAYVAFWLLMRLWLGYVARALQEPGDPLMANVSLMQAAALQAANNSALSPRQQQRQTLATSTDGSGVEAALDAVEVFADDSGTQKTARANSSADGSLGGGLGDVLKDAGGDSDAGGIVVGILLAVLIGVLGAGALYLVSQAPVILADLAVEFVLASGAVGIARRAEGRGWLHGVLRSTGGWFAAVLVIALILGIVMRNDCMEARTLSEFFGPVCGR